jgi:GMP synthase-like glutamine amidotransferase
VRLRVCLIDMNNGVPNEASRCFRVLTDGFGRRVRAANPQIEVVVSKVEPRNLGEVPPGDADLYLSTGGPGAPTDGYEDPWCTAYRKFLDAIVDEQARKGEGARSALVICHSFEIAVLHFGFARMQRRVNTKFGVMPVYPTPEGQASALLGSFGDRFFAWEHRDWEAVDLDGKKLRGLGGELWAAESRDLVSKGYGLLAFRFAQGIEGTQFHPEADKEGALAWILRPEEKQACIDAYGEVTYERMLRSIEDPERLERTFHMVIPGWLVDRFNVLARARGWREVPALSGQRDRKKLSAPG